MGKEKREAVVIGGPEDCEQDL
jgi:hypothetical protein